MHSYLHPHSTALNYRMHASSLYHPLSAASEQLHRRTTTPSQTEKPPIFIDMQGSMQDGSSQPIMGAARVLSGDNTPATNLALPSEEVPALHLKPGWTVMRAAQVSGTEAQLPAAGQPIVKALQVLFPDLYTSETGAKRACRRREIYLTSPTPELTELTQPPVPSLTTPNQPTQPTQPSTTTLVHPGQWLYVVARSGGRAPLSNAPVHPRPGSLTSPGAVGDKAGVMRVIYEDNHVAVVYKASGLPTVSGHWSVAGLIKHHLTPSQASGAFTHARPCHRLDAATCGLMVCAKTRQALTELTAAFRDRRVKKSYISLLKGPLDLGAAGQVDVPLGGKPSVTGYQVMKVTPSTTYGALTTIRLFPYTGRKHQLRRHCAEQLLRGMLGDPRYRAPGEGKPRGGEDTSDEDRATEGKESDSDEGAVQKVEEGEGRDVVDKGAGCDGSDGEQAGVQGTGMYAESVGRYKDLVAGNIALLCLCADHLTFTHPVTGQEMSFQVDEPGFFKLYQTIEQDQA